MPHDVLDFSSTAVLNVTGILLSLYLQIFYDTTLAISDFEFVVPGTYHPPLFISLNILTSCPQHPCCSFYNCASGNFTVLIELNIHLYTTFLFV
jgi:hypothetical protein